MEASVVKGGELCLRVNLMRSDYGIRMTVKTSPLIEKFMRNLGPGTAQDINNHARGWLPIEADKPIMIYDIERHGLGSLGSAGNRYSLIYPGRQLDISAEIGVPDVVNLSFLRIVGVSEGEGVSFHIKGAVHSLEGLRDIKNKIGTACRNLYVDYIRPVDLTVSVTQISSQEMFT